MNSAEQGHHGFNNRSAGVNVFVDLSAMPHEFKKVSLSSSVIYSVR